MDDLIERSSVTRAINDFLGQYVVSDDALYAFSLCRGIIDSVPSVDRWISVKVALPEQSEEGQPPNVKCSDCVLVAADDWTGMVYYVTYGEESCWEFADAQNKPKIDWIEITHWMPQPKLPKGDNNDS